MSSVLWVVLPLIAVSLMYWLSYRIEPHWVSKDGHRFLCTLQPITGRGEAEGRPKEARVLIEPDGMLRLTQRRVMRHSLDERWTIAGKSPTPPARKAVYVLNALDDDGTSGQLALKLPESSRAVPVLDEIIARHQRT
jgi:hypothetical protein